MRDCDPEERNAELMRKYSYDACEAGPRPELDVPLSQHGRLATLLGLALANVVPAWKVRTYASEVAWKDADYVFAKEVRFVDEASGSGVSYRRDRRELAHVIGETMDVARCAKRSVGIFAVWAKDVVSMQTLGFWLRYLGLDNEEADS